MLIPILLVFGFVCLALAAFNLPAGRFNLLAAGLAFWILAEIITHTVHP